MATVENIGLEDLPEEVLIGVLEELGYTVHDGLVFGPDNTPHIDPYVGVQVELSSVMILPGSTVVLDANPVSAAGYIQDYGDPYEDGSAGA